MPHDDADAALPPWLPDILVDKHLDPVFWVPTRTGSMSAWWGHVPFAHWLITILRPRTVVELGTHNGVSFAAFCEAMQRAGVTGQCFAVDTWQGDEHAGSYDNSVFTDLDAFVRARYAPLAKMIRLTFDEAAEFFDAESIDLLHIDGLHTYDAVKGDFERWFPKLSDRAVVLFHDTNVRERDFGVWKFWAEIEVRYPSFQFLHSHGLGVAAVGANVPEAARELFLQNESRVTQLNERFSQLGERWAAVDRATSLAREVEQQRALMTQYSERERQTIAQMKLLSDQVRQLRGTASYSQGVANLAGGDPRDRVIGALRAELAGVYASNSWKLTQPLRAFQTARLRLKGQHPPLDDSQVDARATKRAISKSIGQGRELPVLRELPGRETVIVAIHEATRTGGAILGWNIVQELQERYNVVVLLKRGGPIQATFDKVSSGVVLLAPDFIFNEISCDSLAERLVRDYKPKYVIAVTMETRFFVSGFEERGIPVVALIHEFSSSARPPGSLQVLFRTASEIVFSAQIVADSALHDYRDLRGRDYRILPQGVCRLPVSSAEPAVSAIGDLTLLPPHDGSLVVLGIGTITMRKGVDFFIAAAASVRRQRPELKVTFVWVGKCYDFEAYYLDFLNEQIKRSDVGSSFVFLGEFDDLDPIYDRADIYFLSSRLDPLPNVAIDSAFRGVPVVCFDQASGFADILKAVDSTKDLVVPYLDAESAAGLIIDLAEDRRRLATISDSMRLVAQSHFDMKRYVDAIDQLASASALIARHDKVSVKTISASQSFNKVLFCGPRQPVLDDEAAIKLYVHMSRLAVPRGRPHTGLLVRRPLEGFHPLIYASENPDFVETDGEDPFAHYLRHNAPAGRWQHQIILPRAQLAASNHGLRVAIHGHFHYPDLFGDFLQRLARCGTVADLFVTTNEDGAPRISQILDGFPGQNAHISIVPNRGRDIGPMLTSLQAETLLGYDVVGHFHGKRSLHVDRSFGDAWRNFLWEHLLGGDCNMTAVILEAFAAQPKLGLVFAEDPHLNDWDDNLELAGDLASRMGMDLPLPTHFDFPIGTMFWARPQALRPLFQLGLTTEDLPAEPLPIDGTLLHALERLIPFAARHEGFDYAATYVENWTR